MKPINLKIKGINSYVSEQEIDFNELTEDKLFGVFGETGSGKTTILDCIVIALYGMSERETIPNMINVNNKSAHIHFEFSIEVKDKMKIYTVERVYRLKKGVLQSQAILFDEKDEVIANDEFVDKKLLNIIGIDREEFSKCIALPQGEFDRFLQDSADNRKKTISKLFSLEKFGDSLFQRVNRKREILNLKVLNIKDKIEIFDGITNDTLIQAQADFDKLNETMYEKTQLVDILKRRCELLNNDYVLNCKINELNVKLSELSIRKDEIEYKRKQVDYTKRYGEFLVYYNKKQRILNEVENIKNTLNIDKANLIKCTKSLDQAQNEYNQMLESKRQLDGKIYILQDKYKSYLSLKATLDNLNANKTSAIKEIENAKMDIIESEKIISKSLKSHDHREQQRIKLTDRLNDNAIILDKLRESKTIKRIEEFVDYLSYIKGLIDPVKLKEIYQYDVFSQIIDMLNSIDKYMMDSVKNIGQIQKDYKLLTNFAKDLDEMEREILKLNTEIKIECDQIDEQVYNDKENVIKYNAIISQKESVIQAQNGKIEQLDIAIKNYKDWIAPYEKLENIANLIEKAKEYENKIDQLRANIEIGSKTKNSTIVSIEVNVANLQNYNTILAECEQSLKGLKIVVKDQDNILDSNLYVSLDLLNDYQKEIDDYDRSYTTLVQNIEDKQNECINKDVTKDELANAQNELDQCQQLIAKLNIDIALNENALAQLKSRLLQVKILESEYVEYQEKLDKMNQLYDMLKDNKFIDFVCEEYMSLITNYANNFVYRISQGKFLLDYSNEFYVIDNFNGAVKRSVKTLSGGERFIISLSLALGISQSIASNNNKNFKFFFIDEGFGSLSDMYNAQVLRSFEELIRLDFTVGFISHVEKMQDYIQNRIVVTKKNNLEGSVITQIT